MSGSRSLDAPIHVLLVEEDEDFAVLAASYLERWRGLEVTAVPDAHAALDAFAEGQVDCLVSDSQLSGMSGLELLTRLRSAHPGLPFVLFSGEADERVIRLARVAGATDFLQKSYHPRRFDDLATRVYTAVRRHRAGSLLLSDYRELVERDDVVLAARDDEPVDERPGDVSDVSERRRYQRVLDATHRREEEVLDALTDLVMLFDIQSEELLYVNPAYERRVGQSPAVLYDDPNRLFDRVVPEDRADLDDFLSNWFDCRTDAPARLTFRYRDADGATRWGSSRVTPVTDVDGAPTQLLVVTTDVTDELRYAHDLERQNESLEAVTRALSHDLRSPLSVAAGRLELLRRTGDETHIDHIQRAHERMAELLDGVLRLARQGVGVVEAETTDLSAVAHDAWGMCETADATLDADPDVLVEADPVRLQELLENLFGNCVEHGGPDVHVRVGGLDDDAGFYVEDDGPGVSADDREGVLENGYTTSADGTGLGLGIVGLIAESHGWTLALTEGASGGLRVEVVTNDDQPPTDPEPVGDATDEPTPVGTDGFLWSG